MTRHGPQNSGVVEKAAARPRTGRRRPSWSMPGRGRQRVGASRRAPRSRVTTRGSRPSPARHGPGLIGPLDHHRLSRPQRRAGAAGRRRSTFIGGHTMASIFKELLGYQVEGKAGWRDRKAEEYPEDERNARCAKALWRLVETLAALPDDHDLYQQFDRLIERLGSDGTTKIVEDGEEDNLISRYGFDSPEDDGSDPERFLRGLFGTYVEAAQNGP